LKEAIDKGLVEAEITGMGASSGDSINLELTRLTSYTIAIEIPKGMVLHDTEHGCVWSMGNKTSIKNSSGFI